MNKCPYCGKENCIPEVAKTNVECYGSNQFNVDCIHCGKRVWTRIERYSIVRDVRVSTAKSSDW